MITEAFSKILGFDIVLNQSMAQSIAANGTPILFGDLSAAYLVHQVGQPSLVKLSERYMDQLMYGFLLFARLGGASTVMSGAPNPVASLKIAAS